MGQFSSTKVFDRDQEPSTSDGFVQYQVSHVDHLSHEILINGQPLPGIDIHRTGTTGLQTHTDVIPRRFLRKGQNTIQFERKSADTDNFLIHHVIVHWKELDPS